MHSSLSVYIVESVTLVVYKISLGEKRYLITFSLFENNCLQFPDFNIIIIREARQNLN